jgi:hypothetical protein
VAIGANLGERGVTITPCGAGIWHQGRLRAVDRSAARPWCGVTSAQAYPAMWGRDVAGVNDGLKLVENQRSEIGGRRGLTG